MRLYYVDDLACDDGDWTITMAFPYDASLVLKFYGALRCAALLARRPPLGVGGGTWGGRGVTLFELQGR